MLTRYYPYKKPRVLKNLLDGAKLTPEEEAAETLLAEAEKPEVKPIISYYHPNVTLELVCNSGAVQFGMLPPPLQEHVHRPASRQNETNIAGQGYMYPITYAKYVLTVLSCRLSVSLTSPTSAATSGCSSPR